MINISEEMKIGLSAIAEVLQVMLVIPVMEADGWLTVLRSSYSSCRCENGRMVREGGGNYCWCFGKQHDVLSVAPRVQPTPPSCIPRTWLLKNCRFVGSQRAWPQGSLSLYYKRQTVKAGNQTTHFLPRRAWLAYMQATKHVLIRGYIWRVSDGSQINIWEAPWIPSRPAMKVMKSRGNIPIMKVCDLLNVDNRE